MSPGGLTSPGGPRLLFRSRPRIGSRAPLAIGLGGTAFLAACTGLGMAARWTALELALPWLFAAGAMALIAAAARRRVLVREVVRDGPWLRIRAFRDPPGAPHRLIPLAATRDWTDRMEVMGTYGVKTGNRIIAFRHGTLRYGLAVDHAEVLDLAPGSPLATARRVP